MLILTRKPGESLYIGDNVKVIVVEVKGSQVRLGIDADKSLRIYREEIYLQILDENRKAAEAAHTPGAELEGLSEAWRGRKGAVEGDAPRTTVTLGTLKGRSDRPAFALGDSAAKERSADPEVVIKRKKKSDE